MRLRISFPPSQTVFLDSVSEWMSRAFIGCVVAIYQRDQGDGELAYPRAHAPSPSVATSFLWIPTPTSIRSIRWVRRSGFSHALPWLSTLSQLLREYGIKENLVTVDELARCFKPGGGR